MKDTTIGGYPNPFASEDEKSMAKYAKGYFSAMYADWIGTNSQLLNQRTRRFKQCRAYSRGLQSIAKYKNLMNKNGDDSYLNLDWNVVPIIPKFVDVLVGSLTNQDYKVICTAIDSVSTEQREDDKLDMAVNIMSKEFISEISEATGLPLGGQEGAPETDDELELYMQLNYKQATEIAMEEGIELAYHLNDWQEISKRILRDLVDINIGSGKVSLDADGIKVRYVDPEYLITSYSSSPDFKNIVHAGELRKITIQELKRLAGDQLKEEDYQEIATKFLSKNGNPKSLRRKANYDKEGIENYDYDKYMIDILDGEFKSVNSINYEKKGNRYGGYSVNKKDNKYKKPKRSKYNREKISPKLEVWYAGKWIIGTEFVIDYGLKKNMLRPKSNLSRTIGSYIIYSPDMSNMNSKSLVERMMPFADQIQLLHLKMQQLIAKTRPKGMAMELGSIEGVSKGDGGTFTPLEIQDIYEQTGNLYYRALDDSGLPSNAKPIQELQGGAGQYLQELIMSYSYNLDRIRDVTGINEIRDASTPDKESLVGVQKMALLASNNATRGLNQAYINIMEKSAYAVSLALQDLVKYKGAYKGYVSAIGENNMKVINVTKDITPHDFGIKIQALPDEIEKELLEQNIQQSIAQKELRLEDAIMVRGINNIKLANQMLILRRKQYMKEQQESAAQNAKMNSEEQKQSAMTAAEAASQVEKMKSDGDMQVKQLDYDLKEKFAQAQHQRDIEKINLQGDIKMSHIQEAEDDSDLVRTKKQ